MTDIFDLSGRVALVTGCSGGLGVQMAKALAARGSKLVIIARRLEKLQEVQAEIEKTYGVEVLPIRCDITSTEAVDAMVDQAIARFGRIDILVNNAGTGAVAPAEDISPMSSLRTRCRSTSSARSAWHAPWLRNP